MSPDKQRIAIAEACGWKKETNSAPVWWKDGGYVYVFDLPDYLADLNAIHEAEKVLSPLLAAGYSKRVAELVGIDDNSDTLYWEYFALIHATAAQRCEAFLRTIGKWDDSK